MSKRNPVDLSEAEINRILLWSYTLTKSDSFDKKIVQRLQEELCNFDPFCPCYNGAKDSDEE